MRKLFFLGLLMTPFCSATIICSHAQLIPYRSSWKYLDDGSDQGTAWSGASFNDKTWKTGQAELGYGDDDEATVVLYGNDASNKHLTTYFRKTISIANAADYQSFTASVKMDDGVVVYVNGREVYRSNLPEGAIAYNTEALKAYSAVDIFTIKASDFTNGNNVIAAEVHQSSPSSSDKSFDLRLVGNTIEEPAEDNSLLTRGPYLQMGNQSAVTLRWRTSKPTASTIEVGTTLGNYTLSATNPAVTTEHEVRISGLLPDTKYYYRFGSPTQFLQGDADNYFHTAPTEQKVAKTSIAVFGDCGRNSNGNQTGSLNSYLNHVGNEPADLMLLLGDNAYPDGTDEDYQEQFFNAYSPTILKNHVLFPAPGNHDYHPGPKSSRTIPYYQIFTMPTEAECGGVASETEAYYSFDWGNIHFISMDSYGTELPDETTISDTLGPQVTWLKKDLAANTKPWVIAYWHHPPFTKGSHNSDKEGSLTRIRRNLLPILERHGVDLVLSGHSHNYERSYLLNNYYGTESDFSKKRDAISSSSGKYDGSKNSCPYITTGTPNHGTVYVVSGSAGAGGSVESDYPHDALPFAFADGGMLYLEVEGNRLDGKFLRKDGVVADQFTIMQNAGKKTATTIAAGSTVNLTASWKGNYQWSNGATSRTISVTPSQSTTYRVTDGSNCLADEFDITLTSTNTVTAGKNEPALEDNTAGVRVFPTLVKKGSSVTVQTSNTNTQQEALLVDDNSRLVRSLRFTKTTQVDTRNLPAGTYFIVLKNKAGSTSHKFVVIE